MLQHQLFIKFKFVSNMCTRQMLYITEMTTLDIAKTSHMH